MMKSDAMAQTILDDLHIIINTGSSQTDEQQVKQCAMLFVHYMKSYCSNTDYWEKVEEYLIETS
jgi:hypothetical protein